MMKRRHARTALLRALHRESDSCIPWDAPLSTARWRTVVAVADELAMAPALYLALAKSECLRELPRETRYRLAAIYRMSGHRNDAVRHQLTGLVAAFNRNGIEPLLLRNAVPVATASSREAAACTVTTLDLAVPAEQGNAATETLRSLGYGLRRGHPGGNGRVGEFLRQGDAVAVSIRCELADRPDVLPIADVLRRARRHEVRPGASCFIPGPTDRAFHHLLHAQAERHGAFHPGGMDLRRLYEFELLSRMAVDWIFIEDRLRPHRMLTPLYSYLLMAGALFGTRWPYDTPPLWQARLHAGIRLFALDHLWTSSVGPPLSALRRIFTRARTEPAYDSNGAEAFWGLHNVLRMRCRDSARSIFPRMFRS